VRAAARPLVGGIGTRAARFKRARTRPGPHLDVARRGARTSLVATEPWDTMQRAGIEMRTGNVVPRLAPFGIFATRDGHVALCAPTDSFARGVFEAMGEAPLVEDDRFSSRDRRVANSGELHALIAAWAARLTSAEAAAELDGHGVPSAIVRDTATAVRDPRALRRSETVPLLHPELGPVDELYGSGFPVRFSDAVCGYDAPAPRLGEHNDFVLGGLLGYPPERIEALRAAAAI
jgi:crotonobetainyl-CoA:carnitine CoA-transferase CaiB-like acyl-CoA transferase